MAITIITAPESTRLTTLATVKLHLGITSNTDDALINTFIDSASSRASSYCNRQFAQSRIKETLQNSGTKNLRLSKIPVPEIHTVEYDNIVVDPTSYYFENANTGLITNYFLWNNTYEKFLYEVEYTFGYVLPSYTTGVRNLPHDIELAVIDLVKTNYLNRKADTTIIDEAVAQVYSVKRNPNGILNPATGMTPFAQAILQNYRYLNI
jgi:Phage gp6-like head-tail connector protein